MEVPSPWTCPICGHGRDDVAYVTPCFHQLCYGCALWWAGQKPSCVVCGQKIRTIVYSVRSDEDYLECAVPQPAARSASGLQGEQGPAEPAFIAPENNFPPEVWAAFFQQQPDLRPLLRWLDREFRTISRSTWWVVHSRQSIVLLCLCMHGLDEAVLLQELQPSLGNLTESFVRRLITITAAIYGPQLRRQQHHQDSHAAAGQQEERSAAAPNPTTSHQGPPASSPGRSTSPAGPSAEELPSDLQGGPGHRTTNAAPSEEEAGQAVAAGLSTQGRVHPAGGHRRPKKRKASSSPQGSLPPHKRRHQRQR